MKLTSIKISNFRSIKEDIINFNNNCLILVGKNGAGKSNILKAIAGGLSESEYKITPKDKRKKLPEERLKDDDFYIDYVFEFSKSDLDEMFSDIYIKYSKVQINLQGKSLSVKEFIHKRFNKGVWNYNIVSNKGIAQYYSLPKDTKLINKLHEVIKDFEDDEGKEYRCGDIIDFEKADHTVEVTLKKLTEEIADILATQIRTNLPKVYFWKYTDDYLLPSSVDIEEFTKNPSNFKPLQNIFLLAGIADIKKEFENAYEEDGDYYNLLDRVSKIVTENFTKKWKDMKGIEILLSENGDNITIQVKEAVRYSFADRSDGFKKFISILLMLSTEVECGEIENAVILIDEPDNSLYPTGARYLKDTLINLSKNNIVIYSTHNPFMIDKTNISRHIIVKKSKKDITEIEVASESRFTTDEVLLNAIGTSSFEYLKEFNIVFEGWSDCEFFKLALTSKKHKEILERLRKVGLTYSHGCTSIELITPMLMLAEKNLIIFTDSDDASLNAKKKYIADNGYQSDNWFSFEDLGGDVDETVEDYISNETLLQEALNFIGVDIDISKRGGKKVMKFLQHLSREQKNNFKTFVIKNLKLEDIKEEYFTKILSKLKEKVPE